MKIDINNYEYRKITQDILKNREFKKLESFPHHRITRLEHCKRVSYLSYKVCKKLNLDYVSAARGGLLHDFFLNKYTLSNTRKLLLNHPVIAVRNAKKHFKLNDKEVNIIKCHMFPMNLKYIPKYKESYVVSIVDKVCWAYEKITSHIEEVNNYYSRTCINIYLKLTN